MKHVQPITRTPTPAIKRIIILVSPKSKPVILAATPAIGAHLIFSPGQTGHPSFDSSVTTFDSSVITFDNE